MEGWELRGGAEEHDSAWRLMREADSPRLTDSVEATADRYLGIRVCLSGGGGW